MTERVADPLFRFDRVGRLFGDNGLAQLKNAHVFVVGLGGVGSWAAESLIRTGVGSLTALDHDRVCIMNTNRQLQATANTVGQPKAALLADRLRSINPDAKITDITRFLNEETAPEIFGAFANGRPDYVVDAIDHVTSKCFLIHYCRQHEIPIVSATGSGGKLDPTQVEIADLSVTAQDPLAKALRRILREKYAFPATGPFGVKAVFSRETVSPPCKLAYDGDATVKCHCPQGNNPFQSCDHRSLVLGTASFVTGAFGLACASVVVRALTETK